MKSISVVTPCYNEEDNVREVYDRVRALMVRFTHRYRYEHIFVDNASRDGTVGELRAIAALDRNVKVIINTRNFGHIRSPFHGLQQASGDAVVGLMCDLQDPPELIEQLIEKWESGSPVVIAVKEKSDESGLMFWIRCQYYRLINRLSEIETYENFTGFGLYDRRVMDIIRTFRDPYPYFRGMIAEIGMPHAEVRYHQRHRKRGKTKNTLYTLYDLAMLGITHLSRAPLRIVTFLGFVSALASILVAMAYLLYKLIYWDNFEVGIAPLVIGIFFFGSVQLVSLGIIGEYIGSIHTIVQDRPLVHERERINFEYGPGEPLASGVSETTFARS